MGLVSSTYKHKKRGKIITVIHDNYVQTSNILPNMLNGSSYCHNHHHMQRHSISPLHSTVFDKFSSRKNNITSYHSNPYEAEAFDRITIRTDPLRRASVSNIIHNTSNHEHRMLTRVQSSWTINKSEQLYEHNIADELYPAECSTSKPIDMFLIDISNEKVRVGEPISMNIRHLIFNTPEDIHTESLTPVYTKISPKTTHTHENLLNYIPDVCERYPNLTVDSNQPTRNTLHAYLPL
ncbi:unnamed protein product [Rotaria sp. Silwood1]|nr:unnamed protein product [Rotaria sp. Silwood1]CAF1192043.1 unnamed protein product [Rotaria sp. Silwood1]CAF3482360.1 unnamed protein product [Rotaria sp. Silwood1]CAF3484674.1 unnamed protein product [Rotaria sp. Silwood1]CAF3499076.1 unnamed protein product [Rotaria sp. Silwood1]